VKETERLEDVDLEAAATLVVEHAGAIPETSQRRTRFLDLFLEILEVLRRLYPHDVARVVQFPASRWYTCID
jgi:hypothetical protein